MKRTSDLELDDADGKIVLPRRGAVITLALGWKGQPLFPKGAFTVDEIEHTGAPDRLTIRARSADFRETLNTRREKSWHKTTVGEVVKEIAARHKLKMALGKDLSDKPVVHIDQTNESDGSFLMRLARQYGAIASVKNGNLLFVRQGQGKSASGKPLPVITITRKDGDSHRFTLADRGAYTGVIASWLHTREPAKKESTTVKRKRRTAKQKKEPEAKQGDYPWVRMKTCWYLIAPMLIGVTPNGQRKCSGNACNAALRHSRYNWRKGGQISTRKCQ